MNTKSNDSVHKSSTLFVGVIIMMSISLLSCRQQPQSMFEQQAEANATENIEAITPIELNNRAGIDSPVTTTSNNTQALPMQINKQQAIARQPNCNSTKTQCQYLELNILQFVPEQPWLNSIMWQTIARVLAPGTPLASQDQTAKDTVAMLFNQVEYSQVVDTTLPLYQRIDTELIMNPVVTVNKDKNTSMTSTELDSVVSGYLLVRSSKHKDLNRQRQYLDYVMLDMQKKLQLTIKDILLPSVSDNDLLQAFQGVKTEWLLEQDIEPQDIENWSLPMAKEWYLDERGLHMVYQSRELLDTKADVVDLAVPYTALQGLIKPYYIVQSSTRTTD